MDSPRAQSAVWYGAGQNDDVDSGYYFAYYDPASLTGGGVSATWEGGSGGYYAALPIYYDGPDASILESVYLTPIPAFPTQTRILVTNPRTGRQVVVALTGRGPPLWTGAAISLSIDTKRALGFPDGIEGYVYYQILPN